jgi:hypothetical protein
MQIKITYKDFTLEYQDEYSMLDERAVKQIKSLVEGIFQESNTTDKVEENIISPPRRTAPIRK